MTQLGALLNEAGLYNGAERKRRLSQAKRELNDIIKQMMTTDKRTDTFRRLKSEHRAAAEKVRALR